MKQIRLNNGIVIGDNQPCFVVAELGQNHQGDVYTAVRLMKAAADANADAVKFCKRDIPSDLTRAARAAPYSGPQSFGPTYGEHREALELSEADYRHLLDRARYNEWSFVLFSTVCDCKSADLIERTLNPPLYKIASRDLENLPLLDYVARLGKPMVLSTGLARGGDIERALDTIYRHHRDVVLPACTSEYPTPNEHVGLWRVKEWREKYDCLVGLSDHTPGIVAAQAAPLLGGCMVEKHLTLSRAMKGTDHAASLEPDGLTRLVRNIRAEELMMRHTDMPACEEAARKLCRSLVTRWDIPAGAVIRESDLCLKSPGDGLSWQERAGVIGRPARRAIPADTTLQLEDVYSVEYVT